MKEHHHTFFCRGATWWFIGASLHALWILLLVVWLSSPALEQPLIDWVELNRSPGVNGPAYLIAYSYIFNVLGTLLLLGLAAWIPAAVLSWRSAVRDRRRGRGQCENCAYPIGTSPVCTECAAAVERHEPEALSRESAVT